MTNKVGLSKSLELNLVRSEGLGSERRQPEHGGGGNWRALSGVGAPVSAVAAATPPASNQDKNRDAQG